MKIIVSGGTGLVGSILIPPLLSAGHRVSVLSRQASLPPLFEGAELVNGDPLIPGSWQESLRRHEIIINLAGASIFRHWDKRGKKEIYESRVISTRNIVRAVSAPGAETKAVFSASGVGYYGHLGNEEATEESPPGSDFLAVVARDWEKEAIIAESHGLRVVTLRLGHVLSLRGGTLPRMAAITKYSLGSRWGNGRQWFSFIHETDLLNAFLRLIGDPKSRGPFNVTEPQPATNRELFRILNRTLGKKPVLPAIPGFALKLAAGGFSSAFLNGQKAVPKKLLGVGFSFRYPTLRQAITDLLASRGV